MLRRLIAFVCAFASCGAARSSAQALADLLEQGGDLGNPTLRAAVVEKEHAKEQSRLNVARGKARALGLPLRVERRDGAVMELAAFDGERPVYFITHNVNAAISTGANILQNPPFSLSGASVVVGLWDGGSARPTHQEFGGRVTVKDGASPADHATHVGGTIAAAGVNASAKGMAPAVTLDSYEWTSDRSEMTARGASYPGEAGKIYLSNHSYGFVAGWTYTGKASPVWDWWGNGTGSTGLEQDFGRYDTNARDSDALASSAPYYLMFRSAGNEGADNPATGESVALSAGGNNAVSYDPALHPPGDGVYKSGFDTLGFEATGKNVLTIGAVSDAVSGGVRNTGFANRSYFSSCGPADDGRIKPDLVANGENLFSSFSGSDSDYGTFSGTSMATPNATGSAALLVQYFGQLFPGQAMRASTLKALLIHTADDLGNPGPDYQYGWGLVNVKAAADLLTAYHSSPGSARVFEGRLTSAVLSRSHSFTWDGASPIRATLVWTDPAGAATTTHDSRVAKLVNNLDLKVTAPDAAIHSPYVMPYVGAWTSATLTTPATIGKNNTDNIEQVFVAVPGAPGQYQAIVSVDGALANGAQIYSLVISGSQGASVSAPAATTISPASGNSGVIAAAVSGSGFLLGATVKLTKVGQPDIVGGSVECLGDSIKFRADISGKASGLWNVVITNADGQSATLANAFSIIGSLWQEDFESGAAGWTHGISQGSVDNWTLVTTQSHSTSHSYFAAGPAGTNVNDLSSPAIAIPSSATNLSLSFWHNYNFQAGRDGGVIEFSIDGGAWFDVTDTNAGASFATGGYASAFSTTGSPATRNPLAPRSAWSGANTGFTQVVVNLSDTAKFAGHSLRIRWRLATNNSTASAGWYLDDVALNGGGVSLNLPPNITTAVSAAPSPVAGTATTLMLQASDDGGEPALTYTWSYTGGSFQTPVSFSENGTNAAKVTIASFSGAGTYTFTATVRDVEGLEASSSVPVTVEQTGTAIAVVPTGVTIGKGDTQSFGATVMDQFNAEMSVQPAIGWSVDGGGTIAADGLFTASSVGGPFTVTAMSGSVLGNASIHVTGETFTHWKNDHFTGAEIAGGLSDDLADPDGDGLKNLMEYSLGLDPKVFTPLPSPTLNEQGHLSLTIQRPKALPGIAYSGEAGGAVNVWDTMVPVELVTDGDPQTIRLTDPIGVTDADRRFLHLRVTSP